MGNKADLVLIAAVARNRVIGKNGIIPWHIHEDMEHFKGLTMEHPVIMGRMTYFSIPDKFRPLDGRANIVLTSNPDFKTRIEEEGAIVSDSLNKAIDISLIYGSELYIIGGQKVYQDTINLAKRLEITEIDRDYEGDSFFPEIDSKIWKEIKRKSILPDVSFVTYLRR